MSLSCCETAGFWSLPALGPERALRRHVSGWHVSFPHSLECKCEPSSCPIMTVWKQVRAVNMSSHACLEEHELAFCKKCAVLTTNDNFKFPQHSLGIEAIRWLKFMHPQ